MFVVVVFTVVMMVEKGKKRWAGGEIPSESAELWLNYGRIMVEPRQNKYAKNPKCGGLTICESEIQTNVDASTLRDDDTLLTARVIMRFGYARKPGQPS